MVWVFDQLVDVPAIKIQQYRPAEVSLKANKIKMNTESWSFHLVVVFSMLVVSTQDVWPFMLLICK